MFALEAAHAAPPACVVTAGARTFDLAELGGSGGSELALHYTSYEPASLGWTYSFSACGEAALPTYCRTAAPHAAALQQTAGACYSLGTSASRTVLATTSGVTLTFSSGDSGRSSVVTVECADVKRPELVHWVDGAAPSTYAALFYARSGCALECVRSATGAVCGGAANGACISESAAGPARCVCTAGHSGPACMEHRREENNAVNEIRKAGVDRASIVILVAFLACVALFCSYTSNRASTHTFHISMNTFLLAAAGATTTALLLGSIHIDERNDLILQTVTSAHHSRNSLLSCVVAAGESTFDLSTLSGAASLYFKSEEIVPGFTGYSLARKSGTFAFSACGNVLPLTSESCTEAAVLLETGNKCLSLGAPHLRTAKTTERGLMLTFWGGEKCGGGNLTSSTTFLIECANVLQPRVVRWGPSETTSCSYAALVGSRAGCKTGEAIKSVTSTAAPIHVGVYGMFDGNAAAVLDELWILSDIIFLATQQAAVPVSLRLAKEDALASADVILIGPFDKRVTADALISRYNASAVFIFIASENTDLPTTAAEFSDQLAGSVDLSFGHRRETPLNSRSHGAYLRLPWWLPYTVRRETGACVLPAFASSDAEAWLARPGFTALISSHTAYPRELLFKLASMLGHVDAPGKAFHNSEWPASLPNDFRLGKIEYLRGYRFTICPENSRSSGAGGYNTEKLAQALLAGTVPIYWGDAIDTEVFNPARVIVFNDTNADSVLATIRRLQEDDRFRSAWFREPALAPTADAWLKEWCATAARYFRDAYTAIHSSTA